MSLITIARFGLRALTHVPRHTLHRSPIVDIAARTLSTASRPSLAKELVFPLYSTLRNRLEGHPQIENPGLSEQMLIHAMATRFCGAAIPEHNLSRLVT